MFDNKKSLYDIVYMLSALICLVIFCYFSMNPPKYSSPNIEATKQKIHHDVDESVYSDCLSK